MGGGDHPDEVERLRIALWDSACEPAAGAARHVGSCDECGADAYHRRIRDAFRRWSAAEPSAAALSLAREFARVPDAAGVCDWIVATPVTGLAGVRSAITADRHVVAEAGGLSVDVVLQAAGRRGEFAVAGQTSLAGGVPAADLDVTLFVDRRPVADATTDAFGEFAFGPFSGERWGVRLGAGAGAPHVEILSAAGAR
jgi:hypothetical protein